MSGSIERVEQAARDAGLDIEIRRMGASTRTAEEAAAQCGCGVAQIVKSLIFQGERSGRLYLFLVSGANQLDLDKAQRWPARRWTRRSATHARRDRLCHRRRFAARPPHRAAAFADETLLRYERLGGGRRARRGVRGGASGADRSRRRQTPLPERTK